MVTSELLVVRRLPGDIGRPASFSCHGSGPALGESEAQKMWIDHYDLLLL